VAQWRFGGSDILGAAATGLELGLFLSASSLKIEHHKDGTIKERYTEGKLTVKMSQLLPMKGADTGLTMAVLGCGMLFLILLLRKVGWVATRATITTYASFALNAYLDDIGILFKTFSY
jgi:hypothetical protein